MLACFDSVQDGTLVCLDITMTADGGWCYDANFPCMTMAMLWSDGYGVKIDLSPCSLLVGNSIVFFCI